jgi:RNA polymerase sigma-70 factor (ECF subfamily)
MAHAAIAISGDRGDNEQDLIHRVRRGDRGAEYALYRQYAERIHRLIYRLCGDEELTNDLTQDAFVRAFARLDHFRGDASFGTWIHRIAVNLTLNARRSEQRRARWIAPVDDSTPAPADDPVDPDLLQSFEQAVEALTDGQREVFVMHTLEGYTHVEIGEILGISEGTSKGRLFHARARLRQQLARFAPESET